MSKGIVTFLDELQSGLEILGYFALSTTLSTLQSKDSVTSVAKMIL